MNSQLKKVGLFEEIKSALDEHKCGLQELCIVLSQQLE